MDTLKPRAYHHGNLKQALLDASLELIRTSGPGGFTLREVARMAGVSHNAPYRHFHDKEELLAELAAEGFRRLTAAMVTAADSVTVKPDDPATSAMNRFRSSGRGYVEFAITHPQHFAVMFEASPKCLGYPQSHQEGERAFSTLVGYVEACQGHGALPPGDPLPFALLAWSMVHGVAKLAISGRLPLQAPEGVLDFADAATAALTKGIASALTER
jgi:AcrR family transcriptional regulator